MSKCFMKGDRVQLTELAIHNNIGTSLRDQRRLRGTVAATPYPCNQQSVAVRWDHRQSVDRYHVDFIEQVQERAGG